MSEAARSRRDDARYEPPLAAPGRDAGVPDPLAELARLVGQDDPFRNVFRQAALSSSPGGGEFRSPRDEPGAAEPHAAEAYGAEDHDGRDGWHDVTPHDVTPHDAARHVDVTPVPDRGYHGFDDGYGSPGTGYDPLPAQDDPHGVAGHAADVVGSDGADEWRDPHAAPAPVLADIWARGEGGHSDVAPEIHHGMPDPGMGATAAGSSSARRPVAVLAAVLLLTVGGLAATFLAKGPSGSGAVALAVNRGAPTIMAATGPTKVKIDDGNATAPEDQDAALLNKNGNVSSGPVKIVSSEEQPADLGQLPRSDLAEGARPLPPPSASPFPEPKKVKTFLVHPDGTMLSSDGLLQGQPATGAPSSADGLGAALPATPKTSVKGGATPKSATQASPASLAALAADPVPADPVPPPAPAAPSRAVRQPASPGVHTAAAKPTDSAQGVPANGGTFGLQLASSPVEAEADAAFAKLKRKFPAQLGALTATVRKAETGDKPVYRVRVGGMSQEEAKSLCTQLQGAGGSCYVVRSN